MFSFSWLRLTVPSLLFYGHFELTNVWVQKRVELSIKKMFDRHLRTTLCDHDSVYANQAVLVFELFFQNADFSRLFATSTLPIPPMSSTYCLTTIENVCSPYIYSAQRRLLLFAGWYYGYHRNLWCCTVCNVVRQPYRFFVNLQLHSPTSGFAKAKVNNAFVFTPTKITSMTMNSV